MWAQTWVGNVIEHWSVQSRPFFALGDRLYGKGLTNVYDKMCVKIHLNKLLNWYVDTKKMRQWIIILLVPLGSLKKLFSKQYCWKYCSKCTIPVVVFLKWSISRQYELEWGEAGVLHSDMPQNRIHEVSFFDFTSIFYEKTLCLCVLQFWVGI